MWTSRKPSSFEFKFMWFKISALSLSGSVSFKKSYVNRIPYMKNENNDAYQQGCCEVKNNICKIHLGTQ